MNKTVLVTGSAGLVGSAVVRYLCMEGYNVVGVDNNARASFFGDSASTDLNADVLVEDMALDIVPGHYEHHVEDFTDSLKMGWIIENYHVGAVVHCAAQPSHDKSATIPVPDFEINAYGTVKLLEAVRHHAPGATFVFLSTNKVYGDAPNELPFTKNGIGTRYGLDDFQGFDERTRIDASKHSPFGAGKLAADIYVQEYGRYFGLNTVTLRCGCMTGSAHQGVELHGFLNYLIRCAVERKPYTIYGYDGCQVRDNIDAYDVATLITEIIKDPPTPGSVFNVGGGIENSISVNQAITEARMWTEDLGDWPLIYNPEPRKGDHICYYTDLRAVQARYPGWIITKDLNTIFAEILHELTKTDAPDTIIYDDVVKG